MNSELLSKAVGDIDSRFIAEAYYDRAAGAYDIPERITRMKPKRILTLLLAAVLVLALGITAYAESWIAPVFHKMQSMFVIPNGSEAVSPEFAEVMDEYVEEMQGRQDLYAKAEEYMNTKQPAPETMTLPGLDGSSVTLSEQYYDGEVLLLGINMEAVKSETVVGFEPDDELLKKIRYVAFFHDVYGDDDLDRLLADSMMREIYDDYLKDRTDHAKEYDLRRLSAISLDWMMKNELSDEKYEEAWKLLRETGHICVVKDEIYIGDHIKTADGTDLGPTGRQNMDSSDPDAYSGNIFIEAGELPEEAKGLEELNILLDIKKVRIYYYMELGGPAYYYTEPAGEEFLPFTIKNGSR